MRCCSEDVDYCRPCPESADGKVDLPEPFRQCFEGVLQEEVVVARNPDIQPWILQDQQAASPSLHQQAILPSARQHEDYNRWDDDHCSVPPPTAYSNLEPVELPESYAEAEHPGPGLDTEFQLRVTAESLKAVEEEPQTHYDNARAEPEWYEEQKAEQKVELQPNQQTMASEKAKARECAKIMDEKSVLREASWCLYCCCCGLGCGQRAHTRLASKCICCRQTCESADMINHDGLCTCICTICCCHSLGQYPVRIGTPRGMCCGEICFGLHTKGASKGSHEAKNEEIKHLLLEGFSPAYCYCCGITFKQESSSMLQSLCKCGCCSATCGTSLPCDDDGVSYLLWTCQQVYLHCRVPPQFDQNPICACAGSRCKTHENHHVDSVLSSAPKQQQMS